MLEIVNKYYYKLKIIDINSKRKTLVEQLTIVKIKFDKIMYKRCSSKYHFR